MSVVCNSSSHCDTRSLYLLVTFSQPILHIADARECRSGASERLGIVFADPGQAGILLARGSGLDDGEEQN